MPKHSAEMKKERVMNRKVLIAGLAATALIPAAAFADSISVQLGLGGAPVYEAAPVPVQYEPGYYQPAPSYYEQAPTYVQPEPYYEHPHHVHWDPYRHSWVRYDWRYHQWYPVGPESGWR
jgi:hypothetical protein